MITNQSEHHVFIDYNQPISLFVEANGEGELSYQWKISNENGDFVDVLGATSATFSKPLAELEDHGKMFVCVVTDASTSIESNYMITMIDKIPPVMVVQPEDVTINVGETLDLYSEATGTEPLNPVWKKNGIEIPEATSNLLEISNVQLSDAGQYTCEISNDFGVVTSNTITVTVY